MNLSKKQVAFIALILANIIWGAALPIYKWTLEIVHPFTFAFLRFFLAAIIIFPLVYKKFQFAKQDIPKLIFGALISITFQIPLLFFGLSLAQSINAPIIISSGPIILIGSSIIFLKERVSKKLLSGALISLIGVLVLILGPALKNGFGGSALGNFFIFLATVCGVAQAIVLKKILDRNGVLITLFLTCLIGSLSLTPAVFIEFRNFGMFTLNAQSVLGISYATIFSTVLGYYFFILGLKYINASEIGIFSYVDPIATILVAIPLLNETITPTYAIAAFLVFGGIFVSEGRIHYHPLEKLKI